MSRVNGEYHVALQRVHTESVFGSNGIPFPTRQDFPLHNKTFASCAGSSTHQVFTTPDYSCGLQANVNSSAFNKNEFAPANNVFAVNDGASTSNDCGNQLKPDFLAKNVVKNDVCRGFSIYDKSKC